MKAIEFSIELAQAFFSSEEAFPVDLDDAWKWLGYKEKRNALRQLTNNFEESVDYTFAFRGEQDTPLSFSDFQRSLPDKYMLTVECFKLLAMLAETANGKQVRKYFLECETVAKEAASKLAIASAEIVRLTRLLDKMPSAPPRVARPEPAAYVQGIRCEISQVWATTGPFDEYKARFMIDKLMEAAGKYLASWDLPAPPEFLPPEAPQTWDLPTVMATPMGHIVYRVEPLPIAQRVTDVPTKCNTHGFVFTATALAKIQIAADAALKASKYPSALDLHSLVQAVFHPDVLIGIQQQGFRLSLGFARMLKAAGYTKKHEFRYHRTEQNLAPVLTGTAYIRAGGAKGGSNG